MIDLCIVNYNTQSEIYRLVNSLGKQSLNGSLYNLTIWDNQSVDGSQQLLRDLQSQYDIKVELCDKNVGYSRACNAMGNSGSSDIIALLNSDVWFSESDLLSIHKAFDENQDISILGPKQRDEQDRITHAGIFGSNTKPQLRGWKEHDPNDILYRSLEKCISVSGSAYFIRRSVWLDLAQHKDYHKAIQCLIDNKLLNPNDLDNLGPFLPTPHYYEETFCSWFARHLGYGVYYDGRTSIGHSWHASHEVGSPADKMFKRSQHMFRIACDNIGMTHD